MHRKLVELTPITVASKGRVCRKLDIPVLKAQENVSNECRKQLQQALDDIEKLIKSKQTYFDAGQKSLQSYRALAIQSHLRMVVQNGRGAVDASEIAAESHGFAKIWGGRLVRQWVRDWIEHRELPTSQRGHHTKVYNLLSDPAICAEMRQFLRSQKWAMNP